MQVARKFSHQAQWFVIVVTTAALYGLFFRWAYDDPFITYRYAENLAHGVGFVYNPGERVLSTTTPLWTLLLAPLAALRLDLHTWANLLSALSMAVGGWLFWLLSRRWDAPWLGATGILLYPSFGLVASTIGSETPLYISLCLGAFAAYAYKKWSWLGVLCALATLARPDGILVAALLALVIMGEALRRRQRLPLRRLLPWAAVLPFTAILLGWALFAWGYFGSPIPVTLAAKQSQASMSISQKFLPGFGRLLLGYNRPPYWLMAVLALLGLFFMLRQARRWGLILLWVTAYFAAYSILGVSRYFWYYAPLTPGFILLVGLGLSQVAAWLPRRTSWWAAAGLLAICFAAQIWGLWRLHERLDQRYLIYRAAGEWLAANTPPTARVGSLEIGIIGYYARRPMVDFAGLIQPAVAAQMATDTTYDDTALWAIEHYRPAYLALLDGALPRTDAYARQNCQAIHTLTAADYNFNQDLLIYHCP